MSASQQPIPVVLFAYARTTHLERALVCLRMNRVPLLEIYADGAKGPADSLRVKETRQLLRSIDWCEVRLVERSENMGLGRNILSAIGDVVTRHEAFIAWEDDLVAVPGTYDWLCAALRNYAADPRVMSVTGWTHPRVIPRDVGDRPYFDGRAECWVWGGWARSWQGMAEESARTKMAAAAQRGVPPDAYGADLPRMAEMEERQNIWAVRWIYHHLQHRGLCVRPPWSMVEHIGIDPSATNAQHATEWANPPLLPSPPIPPSWPEPIEHPAMRRLWRRARPAGVHAQVSRGVAKLRAQIRPWVPTRWRRGHPQIFRGDYRSWSEARKASRGYDDAKILEKTIGAARAVRDGRAVWERDTALFHVPEANPPLLRTLRVVALANGGDLNVIDFGGAFASKWWQHQPWLKDLRSVRWSVVEQPAMVEAGRREFTMGPVRYYLSIDECCAVERPAAILLGGVLPYLEKPHGLLQQISRGPFRHVILDRTGFVQGRGDRLTVQHVPRVIYDATYPCWFFDREKLLAALGRDWRPIDEWENEDYVDIPAGMRGMMLERI